MFYVELLIYTKACEWIKQYYMQSDSQCKETECQVLNQNTRWQKCATCI